MPGTPVGSLGKGTDDVKVINPETGEECPPARFDDDGKLLNAEEATGEIVNFAAQGFEGYWKNEEAMRERYRDGAYWTGDLAYRDENGFFYFAGRTADWIRVDGENFAAAPVERILLRWEPVVLPAVYGVPDPELGDRVMAAIQLTPDVEFDADAFVAFLAEQHDLGHEVGADVRPDRRVAADDGDQQDPQARPRPAAVAGRRSDLVAARPRARLRSVHPCRRRCVAGAVRGRRSRPCVGLNWRRP